MRLVIKIEIEDVHDRRACTDAVVEFVKIFMEYHPREAAVSGEAAVALMGLTFSEDERLELQRFDAACSRFHPYEDLRLVLEYCAMDKPSKQGLAKMLARRNEDLPDALKYVRGSTDAMTMLQQIQRVLKKGSTEDISTIAAGPPWLRAEYLRTAEYVAKNKAEARAKGDRRLLRR